MTETRPETDPFALSVFAMLAHQVGQAEATQLWNAVATGQFERLFDLLQDYPLAKQREIAALFEALDRNQRPLEDA